MSSAWQRSEGGLSVICSDTEEAQQAATNWWRPYCQCITRYAASHLWDSHTLHEPNGCSGHTASSCCHNHHHHSTYHTVGRSSLREEIKIHQDQKNTAYIQMLLYFFLLLVILISHLLSYLLTFSKKFGTIVTHGEIMWPLGIPGLPRFRGATALTAHTLGANLKRRGT